MFVLKDFVCFVNSRATFSATMQRWACDGQVLTATPTGPPGLQRCGPQFPPTHLDEENAALLQENVRLAEENKRLLRDRLERENARLARENALLQMAPPPPGLGAPWPAKRILEPEAGTLLVWDCIDHGGALLPPPRCSDAVEIRISDAIPCGKNFSTKSLVSTCCGSEIESQYGASFASDSFAPDVEVKCTSVMARNIPTGYTRDMLLQLLDAQGFNAQYNLVYLPIDFSTKTGFGYAFVNFVDTLAAERFMAEFQGFSDWVVPSAKVCDVSWSSAHQGLEAHVERYRNSPMMHPSMPDELKPVMFVDGKRVPFPAPTKKIRAPRIRVNRRNA